MSDWTDETLNVSIRAIMEAPDGRPSYNLLDAFHKLYHQHEMAKCFSGGKRARDSHYRRADRNKKAAFAARVSDSSELLLSKIVRPT